MDSKTTEKQIEKLERDVDELYRRTNAAAVSQAAINEKLNSMLVTLGELKSGLLRLQERPGKKLDKFINGVIAAIATAVVGFIIAKLS